MCGIVGCVAEEPVAGILLDGLKRVEYRGYDSVGMATASGGKIMIRKGVGRVAEVEKRLRMSELPGASGMAHCLHPSTYVQLADGTVTTIEKMKDRDWVLSLDPRTLKVVPSVATKFRHGSPKELLKVRTDSSELVCTENHMMMVAREGRITEVLARDVSVGDLLVRPRKIVAAGRPLALLHPDSRRYYRLGDEGLRRLREAAGGSGVTRRKLAERCGVSLYYAGRLLAGDRAIREDVLRRATENLGVDLFKDAAPVSRFGRSVDVPRDASPQLLQVVGYFLGAGSLRRRSVRFRGSGLRLLSSYRELLGRLFMVDARVRGSPGSGAHVMDANSAALRDWFKVNFIDRKEEFVHALGARTEEEIGAFLRGVFDAEGTAGPRRVALRTTDEQLARTTQVLLLRLGIPSSVRSFGMGERRRVVWEVSVAGRDGLSRFASAVGSESEAKRGGLELAPRGAEGGETYGAFSVPKADLRGVVRTPGRGPVLERSERPRYGTASASQMAVEVERGEEVAEPLGRLLASDLVPERVNKIERVPSDTDVLYDLEVQGTRNFIANCLFTHNSRWATHGGVTDENAHPHASCGELVAVVHNGIIENYAALKKGLVAKGHRFRSQTDTEVIPHLVEDEYKRTRDPLKATSAAVRKLKGQYAIAVMFRDRPDLMTGARKDAPLIVGVGEGKMFLASDVLAFIAHTDRTIFLDNYEVAEIRKGGVRIVGPGGKTVKREPDQVAWELADVTKSDYAHFTLKEINEQPKTVLTAAVQDPEKLERFARAIRGAKSLFITGAGTSYHAGLLMKFRLNKEARVRADVVVAGELKEHAGFMDRGSVLVAFSQSGETADVLEAVREAKKRGARVYSIVNAAGSSLARGSDEALLLNCGPEVGVAATKSFTAQVVVANLVVDAVLGRKRANGFDELSEAVAEALKCDGEVRELVSEYKERPDFYFVARGYESPVALEGALKLKELSYIHAEGMPASELKHGTLALIEEGTPVVVVNPSGPNHAESLSNAEELRARGADVIGISDEDDEVYKHFIRVPRVQPKFAPVVAVVPLQLLAYHMSVARRNDPDYPRNLAKSVTVK
jgi:glucosamine--fructose-6-phosphate aminotransferase (isomerizing)